MTEHDVAEFQTELTDNGYEVTTKSMAASMELGEHTHDFHVRALVTAGEISITAGGKTRRYGLGDRFTMAAGRVHREIVGPEGVTFVVRRRIP